MNISLNPEHEKFIKSQLEKGEYANALEVINAAFQALLEKEQLQEKSNRNKHESKILPDDYNDTLMQDFMKISEPALSEYWLNKEEDEAWKNLMSRAFNLN
ncbi:MAG: type II toxin-antitoxin system ParD family antitoxin [Scytonematopsis contorta HA4267-MV1]|jgi:putative addiction module CopG family antidote|nr:type II toxin-antitoxin system ParD family antitoxin [Scytonematopsis contorta HA4267-MV1]